MAGVSLITVRRALAELEQEGRVHSHQGVGTFVARPRIVSEPARAGGLLGTLAEEHGAHEITTRVLDVTRGRPSATLAHALQLGPRDEVWRVRRLRVIDGRPMIAEQAVIPVAPRTRPRRPHGRGGRLAVPPAGSPLRARRRLRGAVPRGRRPQRRGAPTARARPGRPGSAAARRELRRARPALRLLPAGLPGLRGRLFDLGPDRPATCFAAPTCATGASRRSPPAAPSGAPLPLRPAPMPPARSLRPGPMPPASWLRLSPTRAPSLLVAGQPHVPERGRQCLM